MRCRPKPSALRCQPKEDSAGATSEGQRDRTLCAWFRASFRGSTQRLIGSVVASGGPVPPLVWTPSDVFMAGRPCPAPGSWRLRQDFREGGVKANITPTSPGRHGEDEDGPGDEIAPCGWPSRSGTGDMTVDVFHVRLISAVSPAVRRRLGVGEQVQSPLSRPRHWLYLG